MNIAEILKDCPKGTKLYSPIFGEVTFIRHCVVECDYPIIVCDNRNTYQEFDENGLYFHNCSGECMLFPSNENRDWSTFKKPRFKRGVSSIENISVADELEKNGYEFKPFDKVLVRDYDSEVWSIDLFAEKERDDKYICMTSSWKQCIPYEGNEHLLGKNSKETETTESKQ